MESSLRLYYLSLVAIFVISKFFDSPIYVMGTEVAVYLIEEYKLRLPGRDMQTHYARKLVRAHPPSTREREGRKGNISSNFVVIQREEKRAPTSLS